VAINSYDSKKTYGALVDTNHTMGGPRHWGEEMRIGTKTRPDSGTIQPARTIGLSKGISETWLTTGEWMIAQIGHVAGSCTGGRTGSFFRGECVATFGTGMRASARFTSSICTFSKYVGPIERNVLMSKMAGKRNTGQYCRQRGSAASSDWRK
jgi:hypothetical protein